MISYLTISNSGAFAPLKAASDLNISGRPALTLPFSGLTGCCGAVGACTAASLAEAAACPSLSSGPAPAQAVLTVPAKPDVKDFTKVGHPRPGGYRQVSRMRDTMT